MILPERVDEVPAAAGVRPTCARRMATADREREREGVVAAVHCGAGGQVSRPLRNEFLEGPQTACCAKARSKTVPFAAMLSITGVCRFGSP